MKRTVRSVATALAIGFTISLVVRALWWTAPPAQPMLHLAAVALFGAAAVYAAVSGQRHRLRMPRRTAFVTLGAAVLIPFLANISLFPQHLREPYATWYIGAVGLLAVVCVVRGRPIAGWMVLASIIGSSIAWIGPASALSLGLVGSIVWTVVAQLVVVFWGRARRDTERLVGIQQATSAWQATQAVRRRERRERVQYALAVAGPVLTRVIETGGDLGPEDRVEARVAEGRLRDELRGANLLNAEARAAIEEARRRGATVTVFDEGGLDDLDEAARERIRVELAGVLRTADSPRLIIRAARDEEVAVTVVGRSGSGASADDDSVELWREIRRSVVEREQELSARGADSDGGEE